MKEKNIIKWSINSVDNLKRRIPIVIFLVVLLQSEWPAKEFPKNSAIFLNFSSLRIFRRMYEVLNIDKNKN